MLALRQTGDLTAVTCSRPILTLNWMSRRHCCCVLVQILDQPFVHVLTKSTAVLNNDWDNLHVETVVFCMDSQSMTHTSCETCYLTHMFSNLCIWLHSYMQMNAVNICTRAPEMPTCIWLSKLSRMPSAHSAAGSNLLVDASQTSALLLFSFAAEQHHFSLFSPSVRALLHWYINSLSEWG